MRCILNNNFDQVKKKTVFQPFDLSFSNHRKLKIFVGNSIEIVAVDCHTFEDEAECEEEKSEKLR